MSTPNTKNLGLVKAIHVGINPPLNIKMLWYNISPDENKHYYYDTLDLTWKALTSAGSPGTPVNYNFNDSNTIDFTNVGSNVSAAVKISANPNNIITQLLDGLFADETLTSFDDFELTGNILSITYTDEVNTQTTRTVDLSALSVDTKLQSASINNSTFVLTLTLSDASQITVNLSELRKVSRQNSTSVQITGDGTVASPLQATAIISPTPNNILSILPNGLFVPGTTFSSITKIKIFDIISTANLSDTPVEQITDQLNNDLPIALGEGELAVINFQIEDENIVQFLFAPGEGIYGLGFTPVTQSMFFELKGVDISETTAADGESGITRIRRNVKDITFFKDHLSVTNVPEANSGKPGQTLVKLSDAIITKIFDTRRITYIADVISITGNTITIPPINWTTPNGDYSIAIDTLFTITLAAAGKKRIDVVVLDDFGNISVVQGVEDNDFTQTYLPIDTVPVCYIYVTDVDISFEYYSALSVQDNKSILINVTEANLVGVLGDTIEDKIANYINSLTITKSEIESEIWVNYRNKVRYVIINTLKGVINITSNELFKVSAIEDFNRRRKVISIVDNTAPPPTEVIGDRYIIDDTGATHANWDGANPLDIVEFNGTIWVSETPIEGWTVYIDDIDKDAVYIDDGTPMWELRAPITNTSQLINDGEGSSRFIQESEVNILLTGEPTLILYGLGGAITTPAQLAAKFTFLESEILEFKVVNNNVYAIINNNNYSMVSNALNGGFIGIYESTGLTSLQDDAIQACVITDFELKALTSISGSSLPGSSFNCEPKWNNLTNIGIGTFQGTYTNLFKIAFPSVVDIPVGDKLVTTSGVFKDIDLSNVLNISSVNAFNFISAHRLDLSKLESIAAGNQFNQAQINVLDIRKCTSIGINPLFNQGVFDNIATPFHIIAHKSLRTANIGSEDATISAARAQGATIEYVGEEYLALDQGLLPQTISLPPLLEQAPAGFYNSKQIVNKGYVDSLVGFVLSFYFNNTLDVLGGIYYQMTDNDLGQGAATLTTGTLTTGVNQSVFNFINEVPLSVTRLNKGIFNVHIHASHTGTKSVHLYPELYKRTAGGVETLIGSSTLPQLITGVETVYSIDISVLTETELDLTDKLVVKFKANIGASGSDVTISLYLEDDYDSRISVPIESAFLSNLFVRKDEYYPNQNTVFRGVANQVTSVTVLANMFTTLSGSAISPVSDYITNFKISGNDVSFQLVQPVKFSDNNFRAGMLGANATHVYDFGGMIRQFGVQTFRWNTNLVEIYLPEMTGSTSSQFESNTSLTKLVIPKCTYIAMDGMTALSYLDVRYAKDIYSLENAPISTLIADEVEALSGYQAYSFHSSVTELYFPKLRSIGRTILPSTITKFHAPLLETILGGLRSAPGVTEMWFPNLRKLTGGTAEMPFTGVVTLFYAPNCKQFGSTQTSFDNYWAPYGVTLGSTTIVVNDYLRTSNAGGMNANLADAISRGATVKFVKDYEVISVQDSLGNSQGIIDNVVKLKGLTFNNTTKILAVAPTVLRETRTILAPTTSDNLTIFQPLVNITITRINIVLVGGTSPSLSIQVLKHANRNNAGTTVVATQAVVNEDTGTELTIAAGSVGGSEWVWLKTPVVGSAPASYTITVDYTIDN
jgi:hypothetical protein